MQFPGSDEYNPNLKGYIDAAGEGDFLKLFDQNTNETIRFFGGIPTDKHSYSYAVGKWTPKAILQHIIDAERVFSFRAFVGSRLDSKMELQSFDEDEYAANVDVTGRSMESIIEEFVALRKSTRFIYEFITEEQSAFKARGANFPITARALGFAMLGHLRHHIKVINERYL